MIAKGSRVRVFTPSGWRNGVVQDWDTVGYVVTTDPGPNKYVDGTTSAYVDMDVRKVGV